MYPNHPYPNAYYQAPFSNGMGNGFYPTNIAPYMNPNMMNNFSPYPRNRMMARPFSRAFANFNYFSFLEGTQKTLNTVNQIIPIVNQVSPLIRNAATVFKVANVLNTMPLESPTPNPIMKNTSSTNPSKSIENPTLF